MLDPSVRHRFGLFGGFLLALALFLPPASAHAQSCTADVQCANGGRSQATCNGDTLIVRRSLCQGSCREIEERRENCGSGVAIRCAGNVAERTGGRCDSGSGRCDRRADREVCVASCACRGNRLVYASGTCTEGFGCARAIVQCKGGCTCDPEPKCL